MAFFSRPRRAFRGDVRFLIGVALVAVSIAGVWFLIGANDDATPVLQANRTITPGETLVSGDFDVVDVALGTLADRYLTPGELQDDQIAARTLSDGELVPDAAVGRAEEARTTTLVIESSTRIPQDVAPGSRVELWGAPPLDDGRAFDSPRILVADVTVRAVIESDGMLGESGTSVELLIDRTDVADVLAAVTGGSALSVVPTGPAS